MKKIFTKLMLLAVAAAALVSCENKIDESTPVVDGLQTVTLTAEKPVGVRTEMIEGVPYWSKGDAVGVYLDDVTKHYKFTNDAEEASLTTSFTGTTAVANTLYVYYPYTANGAAEKGAKVDLPANQEPTATSFDGKADIMLAKPVTLDESGKQISDLEFARLGAIVKVVLKDGTSSLAGQHISSLTMTAANNLTGRVYVDVVNQELSELYYGGSKSVNATYAEPLAINGENGVYVIVYPQTLAAGSTLSFEASTEGYAISKSITLPQDIVLESGKVTTLNVLLKAENLVKEETGLALPFEDDFAWVTTTSTNAYANTSTFPKRDDADMYSAVANVYPETGKVKFGSGSKVGSLTTSALNLSQPFTVVVSAYGYDSDELTMKVMVGEVAKTVTLTTSEAYYGVEFEAATKKSAVTIECTQAGKRFFLSDLQVVAGHDVVLPTVPPVLTVSGTELVVSHEASTQTFTYSVANPVEGVNVAVSDNADWITTSVSGTTVTVNVAENTVEEAREGVITVAYGDLTKTVTVKQSAKPAEGGATVTGWVKVESLADFTEGTYVIVHDVPNKGAYVLPNDQKTNAGPTQILLNTKATVSGNTLTNVSDDVKWNLSGTTLAMKIQSAANTANYLYVSGSGNSNIRVASTGSSTTWKIAAYNGGFSIQDSSNSRFCGIYTGGSDWRSYTTVNASNYGSNGASLTFYKLVGENGGSTPETPATPVLSINPATLDFAAEGGSKTVTCTIENEVSGVNVTATESVDWLTTSVSGKTVTINATENTATTTRTATVTISYTGAESKTVTVNQAAAEVTEPEQPGGGDEPSTSEVFTLLGTDFGAQNGYTTSEASITSKTDASIWKVWGWMKASASATAIQFGVKTKNYILTPACSNDINTIELTCSGSYTVALWDASTDKVITGMYAKPTTTDTSGNGSVKFTLPAGYKQVKIISTRTADGSGITGSNAATYITKIVVKSK